MEVAYILAAYLFGSVPFLFLMGKLRGIDLRQVGTGNIGASNLWHNAGKLWGFLGGASDSLKGIIPPALARLMGLDLDVAMLVGLAAVVGQVWPIFVGFSGGRGNVTSLSVALVLAPRELGLALVPLAIAVARRNTALGMLLAFMVLPLASLALGERPLLTLALAVLLFIILLRRLTAKPGEWRWSQDRRRLFLERFLYDRSTKTQAEL